MSKPDGNNSASNFIGSQTELERAETFQKVNKNKVQMGTEIVEEQDRD